MGIRYEEYTDARGEAPFVLHEGIKRSASLYSERQNWHENLEIQFCKEGEGFVLIDGKKYDFEAGSIALIGSNSIHYTFSDTSMVYSCMIVSTAFCKQMGIDYPRLSFVPLVQNEKLSELFEEICEGYKKESHLRTARLTYLLLEFLMDIVESCSSAKNGADGEPKELATIKKVLLYIRENFHTKISLDMISRHVLTDKYTLCRIFKKNTGQTIFENINAYRCIKASEYIAGGMSIAEAAERCGFENRSFFTKMFKRYMGTLPSKFHFPG